MMAEIPLCYYQNLWDERNIRCSGGIDPTFKDAQGSHRRLPCMHAQACKEKTTKLATALASITIPTNPQPVPPVARVIPPPLTTTQSSTSVQMHMVPPPTFKQMQLVVPPQPISHLHLCNRNNLWYIIPRRLLSPWHRAHHHHCNNHRCNRRCNHHCNLNIKFFMPQFRLRSTSLHRHPHNTQCIVIYQSLKLLTMMVP